MMRFVLKGRLRSGFLVSRKELIRGGWVGLEMELDLRRVSSFVEGF